MQFIKVLRTILIMASLMVIYPSLGSDQYGSAYAKKKKSKSRSVKKKKRKRNYKETKRRDRTNVDFDSVDISGATKTPMSDFISASKPERGYDFIKLRTQWIIEMKQSASSLEKGGEGGSRR